MSVRKALAEHGPRAAETGCTLAIENHQDFTSEELVAFCESTRGIGICLDTGNTFPVAEAPMDFYAGVAPYVRHLHFKDYRVQFTDEGYRLVRCAIGDGAVPMAACSTCFAPITTVERGAGAGRAGGPARALPEAGMVELLPANPHPTSPPALRRRASTASPTTPTTARPGRRATMRQSPITNSP